jgi:uncharacterized peroxidase-related enzyme
MAPRASPAARAGTAHFTSIARSNPMSEEQISWFPVPGEDELPDNLRGLFNKAREKLGFVPNVFRTYSFRPERLSAWFAHYKQLHEPTANLSAAEREMIAVAVSMANGCLYCLVSHGAALREALGDPIQADRITLDYKRAGLDAKMEAVLDFAVMLTEDPHASESADLAYLQTFGLTLEEVWDVIEIAAMYNFTNRMASATGMIPNREYHALAR